MGTPAAPGSTEVDVSFDERAVAGAHELFRSPRILLASKQGLAVGFEGIAFSTMTGHVVGTFWEDRWGCVRAEVPSI